MKNSRQWANEIEEKLNIMYAARRKKRKRILQATSIAACFLIVLTCITRLPEIFLSPVSAPPEHVESIKDISHTPSPSGMDDLNTENIVPDDTHTPVATAAPDEHSSGEGSSSPNTTTTPSVEKKPKAHSSTNKQNEDTDTEDDAPTSTKPPKKSTSKSVARPCSTPPPTQPPYSYVPDKTPVTTPPAGSPPLVGRDPDSPSGTYAPQSTAAPTYTSSPGAPAPTDEPFYPPPGDIGSEAPGDEPGSPEEPETPSLEVPDTILDILLETDDQTNE